MRRDLNYINMALVTLYSMSLFIVEVHFYLAMFLIILVVHDDRYYSLGNINEYLQSGLLCLVFGTVRAVLLQLVSSAVHT